MSAITLFFGGLLGVASWLSPNHYLPWLSFHSELLMGVAGLLVLVGELARSPPGRLPLSPLLIATLLTMCVPLAQATAGLIPFAGDAWMAFEYLLGFALAQVLGQMLVRRLGMDAMFEGLAALFLIASLASVGLQLWQWLGLSGLGIFLVDLGPGDSPFANVAQPNHLASMLYLGVTGLLFQYERGRLRGVAAAALYLCLAFGLVMTGSRTAWLTMGLSTVVLWAASRRTRLRLGKAQIAVAAASFLLLLVVWPALNDILLLSTGRTFALQTQTGPRPLLWASMWDAVSRQPWFGYGWNQGLVAQSRVVDRHPAGGLLIEHSHNLPLELMVWVGVPMALALCGLLAWWFWHQVRAARSVAQISMLAGVGAVFVHAMLEYPLSYAYFLLPVGVMMGALDAVVPAPAGPRSPKAAIWGLAAAGAALLVAITVEYAAIETNVRTLRTELARIGTHKIVSKAPSLILLTQWDAYLRFSRLEPAPGTSAETLAWMGTVVERFPFVVAQVKLAAALGMNGQTQAATAQLTRMCNMHKPKVCAAQLADWRELVGELPPLASVPLPAIPPDAPR